MNDSKTIPQSKPNYWTVVGAYWLMLIIWLIAGYFPEGRIWGINYWAFFHPAVPIILFAVGAVLPFLLPAKLDSLDNEKSGNVYPAQILAIVIPATLTFWYFKNTTHFLGDGYQLVGAMGAESFVKPSEIGESLIHIWLTSLFGGDYQGALKGYQIGSIICGGFFLLSSLLIARKLFEKRVTQALFALIFFTGGYALLFFGYVENYSFLVLSVALFVLLGLLIAEKKVTRWFIIVPIIAAGFFHILGVTLIPAAVYLLFADSSLGRWLGALNRKAKFAPLAALVVIVAAVFVYYYESSLYFRFAFVPLIAHDFTVDHYTLFSIAHLIDYGNLLLLLCPWLLLALFVTLKSRIISLKAVGNRFLVLATLSTLVAPFIFDPKLGMARDWDLFSFSAIPLTALFAFNLLRVDRHYFRYAILALALSLFVLGPRVAALNTDRVAIAHVDNYIEIDHARNRNLHHLLARYYQSNGDSAGYANAIADWKGGSYPELALADKADTLKQRGKCEQAIPLLHQAVKINPAYADAWWQLGECYIATRQFDSALHALQISDGLNPYNKATMNNLAVAYMYKSDYGRAENVLKRLIKIDPNYEMAYKNLVELYRITKEIDKLKIYLEYVISHYEVGPEYYQGLGEILIHEKNYTEASRILSEGAKRGLDRNYLERIQNQFPQLQIQFE